MINIMNILSSPLFISTIAILVIAFDVWAGIHILLKSRNPQSALGWFVVVWLLPFFGAAAYFFVGTKRVDTRAAKLLQKVTMKRTKFIFRDLLAKNSFTEELEKERKLIEKLKYYNYGIYNIGINNKYHVIPSTSDIKPLYNGDQAYPQMLEAIKNAKNEVYLASFIFMGNNSADHFIEELIAAHNRGVEVRVLVDGLANWFKGDPYYAPLLEAGVKVEKFIPPKIYPPRFSINLRNHKKILICDDIAFTGGINIADGNYVNEPAPKRDFYIERKPFTYNGNLASSILSTISYLLGAVLSSKTKPIQDLHFKCEGFVVMALREVFLIDWAFITDEFDSPSMPNFEPKGNMLTHVLTDGLGSLDFPILKQYCDIISCAQKSVTIITPYFLPPAELKMAIFSAASRGVDVRLIVPEKINHFFVEWAFEHKLDELVENRVQVYKQPKPFAHTKLILVDDIYVSLGSSNLDAHSLFLNFEVNVEVFSDTLNKELTEYANEIISRSTLESPKVQRIYNFPRRLRNALMWILSPYF